MESIDVYDIDRHYTGRQIDRQLEKLKADEYMLYALALIENTHGQFLLTRRALTKKWAPGAWEIPGGGVDAGESTETAMLREAREETGLDLTGCTCQRILTYRNDEPESGDNYFCDIYLCHADFQPAEVKIQKSEVLDFRMASPEEIQKLHVTDSVLHYERIMDAVEAARELKL
ncbi:MAG: NUDIX domain-containing protein [Eubacterium sp.]